MSNNAVSANCQSNMLLMMMTRLHVFLLLIPIALQTIDINFSELEYLSDHLTPEECRRLVAAAHFKSYELPNSLDQAETKISQDTRCLEHLLHWNSAEGEGKGETHEVLEHRLRQMGKYELADWLGRTVFRQLGRDLDRSFEEGLRDLATESTTVVSSNRSVYTLTPPIVIEDPTEWSVFDTICYSILACLVLIIIMLSFKACCTFCCVKCKQRRSKKKKKNHNYELLDEYSGSEESEEDKFDVRRKKETPV